MMIAGRSARIRAMRERAFVFVELASASPEHVTCLQRLTTECLQQDAHATAIGAGVLINAARTSDAISIARSLASAISRSQNIPAARIGIDVTSETILDGDMFAATRNIASRVSRVARPGDIVCTETVAATALADALASAVALGTFRLGDDVPPVALYVLTARAVDSDHVVHLDPVCGQPVHVEGELVHTEYDGADFYLCSEHCAVLFEKAPERYLLQVKLELPAIAIVPKSAQPVRDVKSPRTFACRGTPRATQRPRRVRPRACRRAFGHPLFISLLLGITSIVDEQLLALI